MSLEMIGNANFPAIYTENIIVNEIDNSMEVTFVTFDCLDSEGNPYWATEDFLDSDVYFISVITFDSDPEGLARDLPFLISGYYNLFSVTPSSRMPIIVKMHLSGMVWDGNKEVIGSTIKYKFNHTFTGFDANQVTLATLENISMHSLIAFRKPSDFNHNARDWILGPCNIDVIKSSTSPSGYVTESTSYFKEGSLYRGHVATNEADDGVVADIIRTNNSKALNIVQQENNHKLHVIRDFSKTYTFSSTTNLNNFTVKPPLWSVDIEQIPPDAPPELFARIIFSFDVKNLLPGPLIKIQKSPLYNLNYRKIIDSISVDFKIGEEVITTNDVTFIDINHENKDEMFFRASAQIPSHINEGIIEANININTSLPSAQNGQLAEDFISILFGSNSYFYNTGEFDNNTPQQEKYLEYGRNCLKLISIMYSDDENFDLAREKHILQTSLSGQPPKQFRENFSDMMRQEYEKFITDFTNNQTSSNYSFQYFSVNKVFTNYRDGSFPKYLPTENGFLNLNSLESGKSLEDMLQLQNKLLSDKEGLVINEGPQQLTPMQMFNQRYLDGDGTPLLLQIFNAYKFYEQLSFYQSGDPVDIAGDNEENSMVVLDDDGPLFEE